MNRKTILIAGLAVALACVASITRAQALGESAIKVVPGAERASVKVIYAHAPVTAVEVKFTSSEGVLVQDRIASASPKGFIKKYDLSRLEANSYWVEIKSRELTVVYKLELGRDGKTSMPVLQTTTYQHALLASN